MSNRVTGIVKWFDNKKGYGFIEREDTEVFVHFREIRPVDPESFRALYARQEVEFEQVESDKGLQATDVLVIGDEHPETA